MIRAMLRQLFDDGTVYECRSCGTTLEEGTEECPECGSDEVAVYEFEDA